MEIEEMSKVRDLMPVYMSLRDILEWLAEHQLVKAEECIYHCYYDADFDDYITNDYDSGADALEEVLNRIDYNDFKREYEDEFSEEEEDDE